MLPEIRKYASKLYHKTFYSYEQKMPILSGPAGEDAPDTASVLACLIARPENGIKTADEFVKDLDRAEVPELADLRKSWKILISLAALRARSHSAPQPRACTSRVLPSLLFLY